MSLLRNNINIIILLSSMLFELSFALYNFKGKCFFGPNEYNYTRVVNLNPLQSME